MLRTMRGLAIAIVVAVTRIAHADPVDASRAAAIFQQARDLAKAGQVDEACALFAQSYELDPAPGTAVNLADCLEHQGHLRRAWQLFDQVARSSQNVQSRARLARARADGLVARLATVIVTLHEPSAPGLAIRIGDQPVTPAAEIRELIEPSDVELVATLPGHAAFEATLHAVAGATLTVDVPAFAPTPLGDTRRRRSRVYLAGGIGGAGLVGLGVSLGLALSAKQLYDGAFDGGGCMRSEPSARCTVSGKAAIDRAGARADLATGFAIGGALLAGIGAAVFLTAPREQIQLAPLATHREIGLSVVGRF